MHSVEEAVECVELTLDPHQCYESYRDLSIIEQLLSEVILDVDLEEPLAL